MRSVVGLLSKPQLHQAAVYVAGLIWIIKFRSICEIAKVYGHRQIDRLHHLLSNAPVSVPSLQQSWQGELARQAAGRSPLLVLDDTPCERKGKAIEGLGWHHSGNGLVQGLCTVTAMLMFGSKRLLWAVRGYRTKKSCPRARGFRSKISLAMEILAEAQNHFAGRTLTVLMDCWYGCAQLFNYIAQAGWTYISALRSNRVVYINGQKRRVRDLAKGRRGFHQVRIKGQSFQVLLLEVQLPRVGPVRLLLCRCAKQAWHFLVTNNPRLSARQILRTYLQRSWIETLHREIKQELGFQEMFVRRWQAAQKHWTLVALAYNLVVISSRNRRRCSFRRKIRQFRSVVTPHKLIHRFEAISLTC